MLSRPVVRIILDTALLVDGNSVALNQPFDSRLAIHDVVVCLSRDVTDDDIVVVDDGILKVFLRELHLRTYRIVLVCILAPIGIFYLQAFVGRYILVVEMQVLYLPDRNH